MVNAASAYGYGGIPPYYLQYQAALGSALNGGIGPSIAEQFNSSLAGLSHAGLAGQHQQPKKKGGFFSKVGATLKGVAKAPGQILKGVVKSLTDPKTWLLTLGAIALAPITGGGSLIALGAYGAMKSGQAAITGLGQTVQGWQTGDLSMIENGTSQAVAGGAGVALAGKAAASVIKKNPALVSSARLAKGTSGPTWLGGSKWAIEAQSVTAMQGLRLGPGAAWNGMRQGWSTFKGSGETLGARLTSLKTGIVANAKGFVKDVDELGKSRSEGTAAPAKVANPVNITLPKPIANNTTINGYWNRAQASFNNSRFGDVYRVFEGSNPGGTAAIGSNLIAPSQPQAIPGQAYHGYA